MHTLATGLWLPALFLAGLLFYYLLAFHHPAATGFSDVVALVVASMPGRQAAAAQLLVSSVTPVNQDFVLGAQLPGIRNPDGSEPRGRATPAGEPHRG